MQSNYCFSGAQFILCCFLYKYVEDPKHKARNFLTNLTASLWVLRVELDSEMHPLQSPGSWTMPEAMGRCFVTPRREDDLLQFRHHYGYLVTLQIVTPSKVLRRQKQLSSLYHRCRKETRKRQLSCSARQYCWGFYLYSYLIAAQASLTDCCGILHLGVCVYSNIDQQICPSTMCQTCS